MKWFALSIALSASLTVVAGDAKFQGKGWKPLIHGQDLSDWQTPDGKPLEWFMVNAVEAPAGEKVLKATPGPGGIMINGATGRTSHIVTREKFGDVERS
jgi:hypothetical protein